MMWRMLSSFYHRQIRDKILVKLFLAYSLLVFITVALTGNIMIDSVLARVRKEEEQRQGQFLARMKVFTTTKYDEIRDLVFHLYASSDKHEPIADLLSLRTAEDIDPAEADRVQGSLDGICRSNADIQDLILLDRNDARCFYSTGSQSRSVSPRYDFSRLPLLSRLDGDEPGIYITADKKPDYILGAETPVITFAGSIHRLNDLPRKVVAGRYIINLSTDVFLRACTAYASGAKQDVHLLNRDGWVFFSTLPDEIGRRYQDPSGNGSESQGASSVDLEQSGLRLISVPSRNEVGEALRSIRGRMLLILACGLAVALLLTGFISNAFASRIKRLAQAMRKAEAGALDFQARGGEDELGNLEKTFARMCRNLRSHIERTYLAEIKGKNAEIAALQSRINPHFLYNSLEMIRMKAMRNGDGETADMLAVVGRLFRWSAKDKQGLVRLEDEIDYNRAYLRLHGLRFNDRLDIRIRVDDAILGCRVPKLILQPLLENALRHGLEPRRGFGVIMVRGRREGDLILLEVTDNGVGIGNGRLAAITGHLEGEDPQRDEYDIGLGNVHQRLRLIYGQPYGLVLKSREGYWTKVSLVLPFDGKGGTT